MAQYPIVLSGGLITGADGVFVMRETGRTFRRVVFARCRLDEKVYRLEADMTRPIIRGRQLRPFEPPRMQDLCLYPYDLSGSVLPERELRSRYPFTYEYLRAHRERLETRPHPPGTPWYTLGSAKVLPRPTASRLVCGKIGSEANFALIEERDMICHTSTVSLLFHGAGLDACYLLGVLNSQTFRRFVRLTMPTVGCGKYSLRLSRMSKFPIPDPGSADNSRTRQAIRSLVCKMLKQGKAADADARSELNALVNRLYALNPQRTNPPSQIPDAFRRFQ